ncbi:hypothetical protein SPRG_13987 [Saprolegnia parasitica CBS 223.65]|uniref:5'-3' exoribonuclease n=1 Tax=Saprolegnia parasitica (strain CBS 223.65) TaxID=695850 RepID=A0A067BPM3_SAPPC|nr:hypothetical protein SPRG_13987 [Saprolegnia parasitica CBS 223.65]KDO20469.1 hypothetical protein SPRG_13987 [Saprolegnia parasitica CBS 223.65]|eukprot:XP_012208796.1 hypothetical protein SPRG_13987 [Saprolegnia parasitica CBS 223.65]
MGVPAFYRWISMKYPKTVVYATEDPPTKIEGRDRFGLIDIEAENPNGTEFDNLYIDMNGIIHPCAHPEEGEQPKTEEEMFMRLMDYVDRLVACVRPRRLLYMAIDGVAPRAKMNQQRSRRFRSAQEARQREEVDAEAREYMALIGHKVPAKQTPWDSNVITPGTKFMAKLAKFMRFYVRDRINSSPGWKSLKVLFSDAGVPGEGEHKLIMYIRDQRCQPDYDPNLRHVLHGLDADLIMLGLATHEAHFSVLREEVLFGKAKYEAIEAKARLTGNDPLKGKRKAGDYGEHDAAMLASHLKPFQFLHISTLREYLRIEFEPVAATLPFPYDFERIIDDFVFLCFFVGNDFLPHLPCMDIRDGAVDYLLLVYAKLLPSLGGYITNPGGEIDLSRADVLLAEVGTVEETIFQRRIEKERRNAEFQARREMYKKRDQVAAEAARGDAVSVKRHKDGRGVATPSNEVYKQLEPKQALKERIKHMEQAQLEKYREEIKDTVRLGEPGWKTRYYEDKLKANDIEIGGGRERVFQAYIEGLCWVMRYYYAGCVSWTWFYPFHYAPFASDLKNIDRYEIKFDLGQPFCPFEQLMGVFPADSKHAIPKPYQWLMTDPESPILDFYPEEIPLDPNGKAAPWLWIALLPFIDEKRLLDAMAPANAKLTDAEKKRNERFGKELIFFHSSADQPLPTPTNSPVALVPTTFQMAGSMAYHEPSYFPEGCIVPSPEKAKIELLDIRNNKCLSFEFISPPKNRHLSVLLPGAVEDEPVLLSAEDREVRPPFFGNANISIVDMAGAARTAISVRNNQRGGNHNRFQPTQGQQGWGTPTHNNFLYVPNGNNDQQGQPPTSGFRHQAPSGGRGGYQGGRGGYQGGRGGYQGGGRGGYQGGRDYQGGASYQTDAAPPQGGAIGSGFGPRAPNMDALKAGLRNMHAQRGTYDKAPSSSYPNQRYDR